MLSLSKLVCVFLAVSLAAGSALAAGTSAFEGTVKDPRGRLYSGAEIRVIQAGKIISKTKTDADGHYVCAPLPAGVYKVDLVINSTLIATLADAKTNPAGRTAINFDLRNAPVQIPGGDRVVTDASVLQRAQDRTAFGMHRLGSGLNGH